jgi:hypothetical protein
MAGTFQLNEADLVGGGRPAWLLILGGNGTLAVIFAAAPMAAGS